MKLCGLSGDSVKPSVRKGREHNSLPERSEGSRCRLIYDVIVKPEIPRRTLLGMRSKPNLKSNPRCVPPDSLSRAEAKIVLKKVELLTQKRSARLEKNRVCCQNLIGSGSVDSNRMRPMPAPDFSIGRSSTGDRHAIIRS